MKRQFKYTTLLQFGLAACLAGLFLAKAGNGASLQLVLVSLICLLFLAKSRTLAILAVVIFGLALGLWRGEKLYNQLYNYEPLQSQQVTLVGKVSDDAVYTDRGQLEFKMSSLRDTDSGVSLPGTIRVRGYQAPSVLRGDTVEASGKLREGFGSLQGFMSYAKIEVISRDYSWLERLRAEFIAGVYTVLPDTQASLGLGFLVGTRSLLPDNLTQALAITGLTHIVAVSGYNLTILVRLTRRFLAKASLFLSVTASVGLLAGFVFVTGFSPSISRAVVVSGLALTAWYFGREIKPTLLLLAAAVLTAMINPLYIWYDLGWYLSFAAFAGVLILAPLIINRYWKSSPKTVGQIMVETGSAQLMTLPIIALVFSEVSIISMPANMLVLPLIPLMMLFTFLAGIAGMILNSGYGLLVWPAEFLLSYTVDVISFMAKLPWALREVNIGATGLIIIYSSIAILVLALWRYRHRLIARRAVIE